MDTIQFKIDYNKKLRVMRDAYQHDLPVSTIMRRLVELYYLDDNLRKRVLNYDLSTILKEMF